MREPYRWPTLALAWALLIVLVTLVPDLGRPVESSEGWGRWCVICGERGVADALLNMVLFAPLGWALSRWRGFVWAVAGAFVLSAAIELLQGGIAGRFSTLGDVVFNTTGGALGAWVSVRPRWWVPAAVGAAIVGLAAPFVLLAPAPTDGVYYGQWTARFGNLEPYEGRVLEASLGGIDMPSGPSRRSPELQRAFRERAPLVVTFEVGPPTAGLAPVFSVYDHVQNEILLLGVDGHDLVYLPRTRSTALRLDRPDLVFPDAMIDLAPGDTATATVAMGPDHAPCISLNRRTTCDVAPGFAAGWTLLLFPLPLPGAFWPRLADLIWAGALGAPLGWQRGRPARALVTTVVLAALLLTLAFTVPDMRVTPLPVAALLVGAALGALLRRRVA